MRFFLLAALLLALPLPSAVADDKKPPRPNVVFILADDLGHTDLGCMGSKYHETPHLDRLAKQGMRFTHGYTCGPNCQPTRAALMSGQYGPRTGVYTVGSIDRFDWRSRPLRPVDNVVNLPLDRVTLGQAMKSAGYATALFGKWHLGQQGKHHPGQRGFDEAIVSMGRHFDFATSPKVDYPKGTYLADFLTDRALAFIRKHKDEPFFLCLHHFGVHSPFEAKKELIKKFEAKKPVGGHGDPVYAAMLASVDESVGKVVAELDKLKLSQNTLVIFTSDNGGVGGYTREGLGRARAPTDNAPLRGGKGMLYEGGIRVPYLFRWTGTIAAETVCAEPINSVDLYPTLLELAGARAPKQPLDGESYVSLLKGDGKGKLKREAIYWHFPGYLGQGKNGWRTTPAGAIRSGEWKLLEFFEDGRLELYNVREDVGEKKNRVKDEPDLTKKLHARLLAWRKQINAPMPTPNPKKKAKSE
jgi:arylsulfatase A-like enzyme